MTTHEPDMFLCDEDNAVLEAIRKQLAEEPPPPPRPEADPC